MGVYRCVWVYLNEPSERVTRRGYNVLVVRVTYQIGFRTGNFVLHEVTIHLVTIEICVVYSVFFS